MIDILPQIAHNYIAQAAFWGWFTAQAIKFVWQLLRHGKFRPERLVGSGGFPSSHTSFVIATTTATTTATVTVAASKLNKNKSK